MFSEVGVPTRKSLTFCVWSKENYMTKARDVVFDYTWCLGLGGTEGQVIASFWTLGEWHWLIIQAIQSSLSRLSKNMVKLSRDKLGSSKTSTELPVLDFARTTERRLKRERQIAPRDGNILCMLSLTKVVMKTESECVQLPPTRHVSHFANFSLHHLSHSKSLLHTK